MGMRAADANMVALKFFGYTNRRPDPVHIQHEIELLWSLKGVGGIVQIEGVFLDTAEGYVECDVSQHTPHAPKVDNIPGYCLIRGTSSAIQSSSSNG